MKRIGVWPGIDPADVADIVLVKSDDLNLFLSLVDSGDISKPCRIFELQPNGYGHEDCFLQYIFLSCKPREEHAPPVLRPELRTAFGTWRELCASITRWDYAGAISTRNRLATELSGPFDRLGNVLSFIDQYLSRLVLPFSEAQIYAPPPEGTRVQWWTRKSRFQLETATLKNELFASVAQYRNFNPVVRFVEKINDHLSRLGTVDLIQKHYELSVFCLAFARLFVQLQRSGPAWLMLHRAVDLLFQSLGLKERLVIETASGLRYAGGYRIYAGRQVDQVSLVVTESALVQDRFISPDQNRTKTCLRLNTVRNELIYTHGAGCPYIEQTSDMLARVTSMIERLEGDRRWTSRARELLDPPRLDELAIFDAVADVDTFIDEVDVPAPL